MTTAMENVTMPSKVDDPVSASQKMSSVNTVKDNYSDTPNVTTKNYYNITDVNVSSDNFPLLS